MLKPCKIMMFPHRMLSIFYSYIIFRRRDLYLYSKFILYENKPQLGIVEWISYINILMYRKATDLSCSNQSEPWLNHYLHWHKDQHSDGWPLTPQTINTVAKVQMFSQDQVSFYHLWCNSSSLRLNNQLCCVAAPCSAYVILLRTEKCNETMRATEPDSHCVVCCWLVHPSWVHCFSHGKIKYMRSDLLLKEQHAALRRKKTTHLLPCHCNYNRWIHHQTALIRWTELMFQSKGYCCFYL